MTESYNGAVRPEYDPRSETYQVYHDTDSSWNVSTTIILSIRSLTEDEHRQMLPLNHAVDPDVLGRHVRGRDRGAQVSFSFLGYYVTVRDDGRIKFAPPDELET